MDWLYLEPEAEAEWTGYTGYQRLRGLVILGTRG